MASVAPTSIACHRIHERDRHHYDASTCRLEPIAAQTIGLMKQKRARGREARRRISTAIHDWARLFGAPDECNLAVS